MLMKKERHGNKWNARYFRLSAETGSLSYYNKKEVSFIVASSLCINLSISRNGEIESHFTTIYDFANSVFQLKIS